MCVLGFLLWCSISDLRHRYIPLYVLCLFSIVTAILVLTGGSTDWGETIGGLLLGIGFFLFSKWTREEIGYGDSWIILLLGVYLGIGKVLWVLGVSMVFAGIFSLFYLWKNHWKRGCSIPFVPFLIPAYLGVLYL